MIGEMNQQLFQPSVSKIGGMDARYMILIAYFGATILGLFPGVQYVAWLIPLIIFFIDKENKFIAFHAMQAFLLEIIVAVISIIAAIAVAASAAGAAVSTAMLNGGGLLAAGIVVIIFSILLVVVGILALILAIYAAVKAYKYEIYEIPIVGKWAERIVFKTS